MSLALATDGFWRAPGSGSNGSGEGALVQPFTIVVAEDGVNFNEVYVGELAQPIAVTIPGAADAGFNSIDWTFGIRIVNRDTDEVLVNSTAVALTFSDGAPVLTYELQPEDVAVAGRFFVQFSATFNASSGQRVLLTKLPLVMRERP